MKKKYLVVAAALALIGAASIKPAMAYFTDSKEAVGRIPVVVGDSVLIPDENVEGMTKIISIKNNSEQYDAYVRVKAIYGSNYSAELTGDSKANGWREAKEGEDSGYYYYDPILGKGETTNNLELEISANSTIAEDFNVVIIQEAVKVAYKSDGTPYADWKDLAISQTDYELMVKNKQNGQGGNN